MAAALLYFLLSYPAESGAAQASPSNNPPSCAVVKPTAKASAKPPAKANVRTATRKADPQPAVKAQPAATRPAAADPSRKAAAVAKPASTSPKPVVAPGKNRGRGAPQPLYSTRTIAKGESILAAQIGEHLPSDLEREIGKFLGMRYRFGGEGQGGYDCSGLIREVYSNLYGVNLPHSSSEQSRLGIMERVPEDDLKTGDLLFFSGGGRGMRVNHVGMYLAGGYFFHAARGEGVTISRIDESYWKQRFLFSKRIRGLEIGEEPEGEEDDDLDQALRQFSASFALQRDREEIGVGFLDAGIEVSDTLELVLSGFFLNAVADDPLGSEFSAGQPVPKASSWEPETAFRLSAIFSPLEWLKLIPSVTQLNASPKADRERDRDDGTERGVQQLGIETWLKLPSSSLALFMAARADNQNDLMSQPLSFSPDWDTLDVSLGLNYRISDSLMFSIWGTRSQNVEQRTSEDSTRRGITTSDDVSFQLNLRF